MKTLKQQLLDTLLELSSATRKGCQVLIDEKCTKLWDLVKRTLREKNIELYCKVYNLALNKSSLKKRSLKSLLKIIKSLEKLICKMSDDKEECLEDEEEEEPRSKKRKLNTI
jgi:hypothetical protein